MARVSPLKKTVRDMLLSMAVIALPVVAIVMFFPHDSKKPEDAVRTVDYSIPLAQARRDTALPFTPLAPEGLPAGWRATSVHADLAPEAPLRWELGFLTADKQYVALDEVSGGRGVDGVLAVQASDAAPVPGASGKVSAGGFEWQVYQTPDGKKRALVRTMAPVAAQAGAAAGGQVGVVVSGTGSLEELELFASALK